MEWQLIETAPLNEVVLLWCGSVVFGTVFEYADGSREGASSMARGNIKFTHWMPLPEPPK
jgi:hypothetical protein